MATVTTDVRITALPKQRSSLVSEPAAEPVVWTRRHTKWATGDDRFSFPPVPGYTGYIPRSQDYFGKSYVPSTYAALADFKAHKPTGELPSYLQTAVSQHAQKQSAPGSNRMPQAHIGSWPGCKYYSSQTGRASGSGQSKGKPFISGYTGFIPQLRSHFGEPYAKSVGGCIQEFHSRRGQAALAPPPARPSRSIEAPIPGFTGISKGRGRPEPPSLPSKDLSDQLPVPGYRGHIPGYIFSSETSYGKSATKCLHNFHQKLTHDKNARQADIVASRLQL